MMSTAKPRVSLLWAGPERAQEIAQLHGQLFQPPWDATEIVKMLEHPASTALVALLDRQVCGFVMAQIAADEAEVLSIGVNGNHQRTGLAVALMEGLVRALQRAEVKRLFLEVAEDNAAAQALYTKLGFKEIGRRKNYYQRASAMPVDAVNLTLAL